MNSYMTSLEWAIDFDRKTTNRTEIALRNSFIDSVTEQALGGKSIKDATGKRIWDTKHSVPYRLTAVHLFATFLTPTNRQFNFPKLINALARKCKDTTMKSHQKNRYLMIMRQMKSQSESW